MINGQQIVVTLPDPVVAVTSSRVDHKRTKQFIDITRFNYTDAEMTEFTKQGLASILETVPELGILETSRQSAASVLIPMIQRMGYAEENIVITFRKEFTSKEIPNLLDAPSRKLFNL